MVGFLISMALIGFIPSPCRVRHGIHGASRGGERMAAS